MKININKVINGVHCIFAGQIILDNDILIIDNAYFDNYITISNKIAAKWNCYYLSNNGIFDKALIIREDMIYEESPLEFDRRGECIIKSKSCCVATRDNFSHDNYVSELDLDDYHVTSNKYSFNTEANGIYEIHLCGGDNPLAIVISI